MAAGKVLYWLSTEAVGDPEFDSRDGFISSTGERVPPLPAEAYAQVRDGG
jgi:hypothetical protein